LHSRSLIWRAPLRNFSQQIATAASLIWAADLAPYCCFLQEAGYVNTLGVETSPDQVEFARQLGVRSVVSRDLIPFLRDSDSEMFDVVIAFDVIEHFRKDEVLEIMDHVYNLLRPGGKMIVHVPNAEGIFGSRIFWSDFTHEMAFPREGLRQLTCACGFNSIEFSEDLPVVHGVKSLIRAFCGQVCAASSVSPTWRKPAIGVPA
jgi:SAM-dependent methyltransferase